MDYLDGFQYKDGNLQFFPTSEGYIRATDVNGTITYSYVYNYTDHLGNIRLSYAKDPENPNVLKILEEDHYYPFGLKHTNYNSDLLVHREYRGALTIKDPVTPEPLVPVLPYNYKYNGKEFQDEMGLNIYAHGWRDYDPAIGRFHKMDRFTEKYHRLSPYGFTANNPIYFMEIQGDSIDVARIKQFDVKNKTNYIQAIIDDLNSQTGLTFIVNSKGQLVYQTDANGNAVISTTTDANGNITQNGSAEARQIMMSAISSTNIVSSRIATTGRTGVPGIGVV